MGKSFGFLMAKKKKMSFLEKVLEYKLKNIPVNSLNIFRVEDLKKVTDNYAPHMIIDRGAYSIVYRGILRNKRVVAIKKSKLLDQSSCEQFLNEIVILGQTNHPNVVQLLGCCLETEVPLVVYEFVSNTTLFQHIDSSTSARLTWDNRLRIAHESAGALAFLHTMSIIHRDVKSSNILLDENYTSKVTNFGLAPLGQYHVTTLIMGTLGYLDPEYIHSSRLTDKSDVYSFGVVLAELMTGEKPRVERCDEEKSLATYFVEAIRENRLPEIVDREVLKEATDQQLRAASGLVCRCLDLEGRNRPSMKEVTMKLEMLSKFGKLSLQLQ